MDSDIVEQDLVQKLRDWQSAEDAGAKVYEVTAFTIYKEAADTIERLQREVEVLAMGGIAEIAARNPSVMEYMEHWESRAERAEAREKVLRDTTAELRELRREHNSLRRQQDYEERHELDVVERIRAAEEVAYRKAAEIMRERRDAYDNMRAGAERRGPSYPGYVTDETHAHWGGKSSAYSEADRAILSLIGQPTLDAVIREAVEAERERCAQIADDHTPGKHMGGTLAAHCTGKAIAAAIRQEPVSPAKSEEGR